MAGEARLELAIAVLETGALAAKLHSLEETMDDVMARFIRGEITVNEARKAVGLPPIDDGDTRPNPPLPSNFREALAEVSRRCENGTDCRNRTGVTASTVRRSTTELSRQGEKDG